MLEVTRYQCEHCHKRHYKSRAAAKVHEKNCFHNPAVRSCATCENAHGDRCSMRGIQIFQKLESIMFCRSWKEEIIPDE